MAISYTISYSFSPSTTISSSQVNQNFTDNANTWTGLEAKTKTFSNLGVDTQLKSAGTIESADGAVGAPGVTFTADTDCGVYRIGSNNIALAVAGAKVLDIGTAGLGVTGTLTPTGQILLANGTVGAPGIAFASDTDNGIYYGGSANVWKMSAGGVDVMDFTASLIGINVSVVPNGAGSLNFGDGTNYWGDISYKTLTDRGCLGWFDEGVELQDGTIVSDCEALSQIEKDSEKTTIYGKPMLRYSSFPKVAYKKPENAVERDGKYYVTSERTGEEVEYSEGIEMTSMFSIFIGAFKELNARLKVLEGK